MSTGSTFGGMTSGPGGVALANERTTSPMLTAPGSTRSRFGVFGTTVVAFFLAEMGDKTQIATIALAAQYNAFYSVVAGTTLGMMIANVPAVFLGDALLKRVPLATVRYIAAALFAVIGVWLLAQTAGWI